MVEIGWVKILRLSIQNFASLCQTFLHFAMLLMWNACRVNNSNVRAINHTYIHDPREIQMHHFIVSLEHLFHFQHSGIDMVETRTARRARELSERFYQCEPLAIDDPGVLSTIEDAFYSRRASADPKVRFPNSNHFLLFIHTDGVSIHLLPRHGHRSWLSLMVAKPDDGLWPKIF